MNAITSRAGTSSLQRLMAALLVVSAVVFVIGILLERSGPAAEVQTLAPPLATLVTGSPAENGNESAEANPQATGSAPQPEIQGETSFGLNLENPWLVAAFALASVALAAALLRFGWPALLLAFLLGAGAAVLDLQEVLTQLGRGNLLVAGLAGLVAAAHLAVAFLAIVAWARLRAAPAGPLGPV